MDLVKRMKDMTRATLNEMLENSEDPVRAIDRYINEQRQNIRELELLYRDQLKHAHSLRKQIDDAAKIAEKREQQAELAMRAGEEHVARMALEDKIAQEEKRERYKQLYAQAKETLIELEERLGDLQNDLREVVDKRQYYSARMESIHLRKKISERKMKWNTRSTNWFDRLEDMLTDLELESDVLDHIVFGDGKRSGRYSSTHRSVDAVDREIERLKKKMDPDRRETD